MSEQRSPLGNNNQLEPDVSGRLSELDALRNTRPEDSASVQKQIAQVKALLGDAEAFAVLRRMRWPEGIVCPRCGSSHVQVRHAPRNDTESAFRRFYECLDCKHGLGESTFDDLTGLPMDSISSIGQWVLCWFTLGFCSPSQAAQFLGIGLDYLLQVAMSHDLAILPPEQRMAAMDAVAFRQKQKKVQAQSKEAAEVYEERNKQREVFSNIRNRPTRWK